MRPQTTLKSCSRFVRNVEFDRVGVFTYSDEEGTAGIRLAEQSRSKIATQRRARLMKEQSRISRRRNKARVGETVRVLFEGESIESDLFWQGRMETQAPDIDGCVLINDAPEGFVPRARRIRQRIDYRGAGIRSGWGHRVALFWERGRPART